jgi:hypothetical protein
LKAIIIEDISNIVKTAEDMPGVFGIFEGRSNGYTTFTVHKSVARGRRRVLSEVFQDHVGMSGCHDGETCLIIFFC